jgi:hypothetical protein
VFERHRDVEGWHTKLYSLQQLAWNPLHDAQRPTTHPQESEMKRHP